MTGTQDPTEALSRVLQAGREVRLGKGVVAKTSHVALSLVALWAVVAWRLSDSLVMDAALIGVGVLATVVAVWWIRATQSYAERNPGPALLEGAEFLEYRRMEEQAKGLLPAPKSNDRPSKAQRRS